MPDHSTISKTRHGRFRDSDAFRDLFESVLRQCIGEDLVGGEGFAKDVSVIKAEAQRQRAVPGTEHIDWSGRLTRPVEEYLAALDAANPAAPPKYVSITDSAASSTATAGPAFFAYSTNYLIDVKAGIIVDVESSQSRHASEAQATPTMIDRVEQRLEIIPHRLIGDTSYRSASMLGWLVKYKGIAPHVPVWDKSAQLDGTFAVADFVWEPEADQYRCLQEQCQYRA